MEKLRDTLLLTDKGVLKAAVVAVLSAKLFKNLTTNKDFYFDVFKFNTKNYNTDKKYGLNPEDLDPAVGDFLSDVYSKLNLAYKKIFEKLNLIPTFNTSHIPLEVKWVHEYKKKYGNTYNSKNKITTRELLQPLSESEKNTVRLKFV